MPEAGATLAKFIACVTLRGRDTDQDVLVSGARQAELQDRLGKLQAVRDAMSCNGNYRQDANRYRQVIVVKTTSTPTLQLGTSKHEVPT